MGKQPDLQPAHGESDKLLDLLFVSSPDCGTISLAFVF